MTSFFEDKPMFDASFFSRKETENFVTGNFYRYNFYFLVIMQERIVQIRLYVSTTKDIASSEKYVIWSPSEVR